MEKARGALCGYVIETLFSTLSMLPTILKQSDLSWGLLAPTTLALLVFQIFGSILAGWVGIALSQRMTTKSTVIADVTKGKAMSGRSGLAQYTNEIKRRLSLLPDEARRQEIAEIDYHLTIWLWLSLRSDFRTPGSCSRTAENVEL